MKRSFWFHKQNENETKLVLINKLLDKFILVTKITAFTFSLRGSDNDLSHGMVLNLGSYFFLIIEFDANVDMPQCCKHYSSQPLNEYIFNLTALLHCSFQQLLMYSYYSPDSDLDIFSCFPQIVS